MAKKEKRIDVYELRKELMEVAEKEARKKPDISKEDLKKHLSTHLTKAKLVEQAMTPTLEKLIERIIGIAAEVAIKMVEIYLREKKHSEEDRDAAAKSAAKAAPAKKAPAKKAAAKPKKKVVAKKK